MFSTRGYRLASAERTVLNVPDSGGQGTEGFVGQEEDFEMDSPGEWRASGALENKGDVVTGPRVGEQTSSGEFWTYCSLDGR